MIPWTDSEDDLIRCLISKHGESHWTSYAKILNAEFYDSVPVRKPKQLRSRWVNRINPTIVKGNWTEEEDRKLEQLQVEHGNKWSLIARELTGRNEN